MSIEPHQLPARYKGTIEHLRRQQDGIWEYLHATSEHRVPWLLGLEREMETLDKLMQKPGIAERIHFVIHEAPQNVQDAFFFVCVTVRPSMQAFLLDPNQVRHHSPDRLGDFVMNMLPALVEAFLKGHNGILGPDAFMRNLRPEYIECVGFHPDPVRAEEERVHVPQHTQLHLTSG